jgi:hypothetical protein
MSMLTFLSLALPPLSAKEIAATTGNGYSSRIANAPVLLFVLGTAVGIVQDGVQECVMGCRHRHVVQVP